MEMSPLQLISIDRAGQPSDRSLILDEIAYFTFPEFEGRGIATAMARELLDLAKTAEPGIVVTAQTLPQHNASTRILEKLDFARAGTAVGPGGRGGLGMGTTATRRCKCGLTTPTREKHTCGAPAQEQART